MFFLLSLLSSFKNSSEPTPTTFPTPTIVVPIIKSGQNAGIFDPQNFSTYLKIAEKRPALSQRDAGIRQSVINSLGNKTGILYEDADVQIAYLESADDFEVEIKTNDVSRAEQKAVSYFASKNLSIDGLCKLPIFFFASPEVLQNLKANNDQLQVTPLFCENLKL